MSVDLVRIVDSIHRDKNIPKEILFEGIQSALGHRGQEALSRRRRDPRSTSTPNGQDQRDHRRWPDGPAGASAGSPPRRPSRSSSRRSARPSATASSTSSRTSAATWSPAPSSGSRAGPSRSTWARPTPCCPASEQIPGESHHPGERVRAVILDVRKVGQRVKIILSRTHPDFVRRLFELEIPEIADQIISIRALAREAGYRSKVAVSSIDAKVDAVGACVGVRGTRIKNIVDELGGERIDIVRWNESLQVLIPNALQPAEIDEVMLCQLLGRAIVLVREDQLSLAIGRRGQNVRLASKLVGWDIEIMTSEELDELIEKAVGAFTRIEGVDTELAEKLVEQGILSYDDLSVMEIDDLVNTIEGSDRRTGDGDRRRGPRPWPRSRPTRCPAARGASRGRRVARRDGERRLVRAAVDARRRRPIGRTHPRRTLRRRRGGRRPRRRPRPSRTRARRTTRRGRTRPRRRPD